MAITLVEAGHNRLRYLLVEEGGGFPPITTTGAASPDLLTDSLAGPLKQLAQAFGNGLGQLPAGALDQADARAIWLADNSDAVLGNGLVPRAICMITKLAREGVAWSVDADVDGQGHPELQVVNDSEAGGPVAFLDVIIQGSIGL